MENSTSHIHINDITFAPVFPVRQNTEEFGGVLGTPQNKTKVPTPSSLIDKTVKIVKITWLLLNFFH